MKGGPYVSWIALAVVIGAPVAFLVLSGSGAFNTEVWKREHPLVGPSAVAGVRDGVIALADGRAFRAPGVGRRGDVSADEYDRALRATVAQGVVVVRDLGDGRAFLLAEPGFYNSCGTRNYNGNPWARWAGSYLRCPLSELLVQSGYAHASPGQPGLTPRERWRLEGVEHITFRGDTPRRISLDDAALEYESSERYFADYDATLAMLWKPPPTP